MRRNLDPSNPDVGKEKIISEGNVEWKNPNRGSQNLQKYIRQQKNVVAGKNLPYVSIETFILSMLFISPLLSISSSITSLGVVANKDFYFIL